MRIRPATEDDFDDITRIFEASVGWLTGRYRPDQVETHPPGSRSRSDFYRHLLGSGTLVLAEDPEPAGFAAAVVRDGVWFLSQLWVLPERHGAGIGSALLDETLAWGRSAGTFSVVASTFPAAQRMYLRASMYPLWTQIDLLGSFPAGGGPEGIDALTVADQPWMDELDREMRGTARPEDHVFWRQSARGFALRREGMPVGYMYGWADGKVGPGAARDPSDIPRLLQAASGAIPEGQTATVAVPSTNWTALRELIRLGFAPMGSNTFMASRPLGDASRYISSGGALA
jgi:ribosomal protein S18 acetylase RimI-like enzyme